MRVLIAVGVLALSPAPAWACEFHDAMGGVHWTPGAGTNWYDAAVMGATPLSQTPRPEDAADAASTTPPAAPSAPAAQDFSATRSIAAAAAARAVGARPVAASAPETPRAERAAAQDDEAR